eukprot:scaffold14629_cov72-Cyclotella_meneghiniana.AAC.5
MVALNDDGGVVKVKPKQIEPLDHHRRSSRGRHHRSSRGLHSSSRRSLNHSSHRSQSGSSKNLMGQEVVATLESADSMFDLADTDGNGYLSFDEFEYYMRRHTKHSIEMIQDVFAMIDKDGDGEVTREEVRANFLKRRRELIEKQGGQVEAMVPDGELLRVAEDADKMFDKADVSGDGELTLKEFQLYMKRHTDNSDNAIAELFSMMDEDHDGFITREEVRRVFLKQKQQMKMNAGKGGTVSMAQLLGVDDDDMAELCDDVYSMFFLASLFTQSFFYALYVFFLKQSLIIMIAIYLINQGFPANSDVPTMVRATQFLLMPVNFALQEELVVTFYIYSNMYWDKAILDLYPGAVKWKFHLGNLFRFLDGLSFLFINTTLLLQATDILGMFLNFAALQFLQSIDNVALDLAKDGYLSESLEDVANAVALMKLPRNHSELLQVMDSCCMLVTFVILILAWLLMMLLT